MRVLYVPSWYPSDKNPFAGSFIADLAQDLASEEIHIEVVAFHYHVSDISRDQYEKIEKGNLIEHHFYGWSFPKINTILQEKWIKKCIKALRPILKDRDVDFIHAHDYVATFLADEIAEKYEIPLLISLHHSDIMMDMVPTWRKKNLQEIFRRHSRIIVPSTALKDGIERNFGSYEFSIFPNYLNLEKIKARSKLNLIPHKFIAIGSLEPLKNHIEAIDLFQNFDGELFIYGEGPSRNVIETYIKKNQLENKIHLEGAKDHVLLLEEIHKYDALISTSKYETFGIGILEAIASGIPVICKNKYGPLDFINKINGVFIDDNFSLKDFAKEYKKYNSKEISSSVMAEYGKETVIPRVADFYRTFNEEICAG